MVFKQLATKIGNYKSSELIFLGAPEAEAEALPSSRMPLFKVYVDHHNLAAALEHEKFIICGRKGAGKSAFAEYISLLAEDEPNLFCKFIRQGESNLEHVVQIGKESGHEIERENLYTWLILTNILKLFADNHAAHENNEYRLLEQFLKKNSGYIDIRNSEIKEIIVKSGFEIDVEYLKRYLTTKHKKDIEIKQTKAPFYKLIPHLKEIILKILLSQEEKENGNSYVLFFDDLDITFNAKNQESIESIVSLLRVSKEINNSFFAKNGVDAKVVILLRDDIAKSISIHSSDTAKIFSSYSASINWYQDEYLRFNPETELHIRKFLNARIKLAFTNEHLEWNKNDPWLGLVEDPFVSNQNENNHKTSFRYILEGTFFRPRDLILFFSPLAVHKYKLPLSKYDVNHLMGRYCDEVVNELKNELYCFYEPIEILSIFNALGAISKICRNSPNGASYSEACAIIQENCKDVVPHEILSDLFERSFIGNITSNRHVHFKHREPSSEVYKLNPADGIILHNSIRIYCLNRGFS